MRWLVRFGYDGRAFSGWARQPGLRTVEGEILRGLVRLGVVPVSAGARLEVASRTDRGVSARANALALTTDLSERVLLRSLNGISTELTFTAATPVSEEFRVRRALRRTYRYFEPGEGRDLERWKRAARVFSGSIDVRSFGRAIPSAEPTWRTVEPVAVSATEGGLVVEIRAPGFVWGMVRKMVAALREYDAGRLTLARLEEGVHGRDRLTLPMAEPEGLVLWEVEYPFPWKIRWEGPNRRQRARMRALADSQWVRAEVTKSLDPEERVAHGSRAGRG
jgi:tRNA pseudouridine38-40 synthase